MRGKSVSKTRSTTWLRQKKEKKHIKQGTKTKVKVKMIKIPLIS